MKEEEIDQRIFQHGIEDRERWNIRGGLGFDGDLFRVGRLGGWMDRLGDWTMIHSLSRKGWIVCVIDNLRFFKKGGRIFLSLLASLLCCFVFERGGGEKELYENFISQILTNQTMNFFFLRTTGKNRGSFWLRKIGGERLEESVDLLRIMRWYFALSDYYFRKIGKN